MALFGRYLDNVGLTWFIDRWLGPVRKSNKGQSATECLRQILLFFIDGSSRHLTYFDSLKEDAGTGVGCGGVVGDDLLPEIGNS